MDVRFLGHSCFELSEGEHRVLLDPFLAPNNPAATLTGRDVDPQTILVSHGHADHLADAVGIAKRSGATCAAIVELSHWLSEQGVESTVDPNLGGTVKFDWGWAKLVPAMHSSTAPGSSEAPFSPSKGTTVGVAGGWVVKIGGKTVYHLGDTALFSDLQLVARTTPVDIALIPVGGHYTMDRHDAVIAAEFIGAETVIPMHHSTFPPIETDLDAFKADVDSQTSSTAVLLKPGETHSA